MVSDATSSLDLDVVLVRVGEGTPGGTGDARALELAVFNPLCLWLSKCAEVRGVAVFVDTPVSSIIFCEPMSASPVRRGELAADGVVGNGGGGSVGGGNGENNGPFVDPLFSLSVDA